PPPGHHPALWGRGYHRLRRDRLADPPQADRPGHRSACRPRLGARGPRPQPARRGRAVTPAPGVGSLGSLRLAARSETAPAAVAPPSPISRPRDFYILTITKARGTSPITTCLLFGQRLNSGQ